MFGKIWMINIGVIVKKRLKTEKMTISRAITLVPLEQFS